MNRKTAQNTQAGAHQVGRQDGLDAERDLPAERARELIAQVDAIPVPEAAQGQRASG